MGYRGAGADAEEGESVAFGVGDEVAGGVGYAVYFVERVREVSDAGRTHKTTLSCRKAWLFASRMWRDAWLSWQKQSLTT